MVRENTTQRLFDKECGDLVDTNINMIVPWYLMAAYAYYVIDDPLLEDTTFDRLAKKMLANWDNIEHMHKGLITVDMLKAGTYLGEYPKRIEFALENLRGRKNGRF